MLATESTSFGRLSGKINDFGKGTSSSCEDGGSMGIVSMSSNVFPGESII